MTKDQRDDRRVEKWLANSGGLPPVAGEARELLVRRLAARHRAGWICAPLNLLAAIVLASAAQSLWADREDVWRQVFIGRYMGTLVLMAAANALFLTLTRQAEARIAESLPRRATRGTYISVWIVLGRPATAAVIAATTWLVLRVGVMVWAGPGWLVVTYLVGLVASGGLAVFGLHRAATRATIAVDPMSVTIDERLRTEEALKATRLVYSLAIAASPAIMRDSAPHWLDLLEFAGFFAFLGLQMRAEPHRPWRRGPQPVPPAPRRAREGTPR